MNCHDVQIAILAEPETSVREASEHLAQCVACRAFSEAHAKMLDAQITCEPAAELDAAVLRMARTELTSQSAANEPEPRRQEHGLQSVSLRRKRSAGCGQLRRFPGLTWRWAAVAASVALAAVLMSLAFFGSMQSTQLVHTHTPAPPAVASLSWQDNDLEATLMQLEADVEQSEMLDAQLAQNGTSDTGVFGTRDGVLIDDAVLELELDILLENDDLWRSSPTDGRRENGTQKETRT